MEKEIKWDTMYSTYWWEIELDPKHTSNYSKKAKILTGYSKAVGHDEPKDKYALLMSKIIMLHSKRYFEKARVITINMKAGDIIDKNNPIGLVRLYRDDYKINPHCITDGEFYNRFFVKGGIINFLTKFFEYIRNDKDVRTLSPSKRQFHSKDDFLNPLKHSFTSEGHLHAYGEKMIRDGHPIGAVMNFIIKCKDKLPPTI